MSEQFRVMAIDDDPFVRDVLRRILEPEYAVEAFAAVADCLARIAVAPPDMFLLDVLLPGVDGYAFCRSIKDDLALRRIPVTFISSQDGIEARLKGYDAGGEDFIVKPFDSEEVRRKVRIAQQIAKDKGILAQQLADSELLSSLVMSNMDEYAILVRFIRELVTHATAQEVATGLLDLLQRYRLDGAVQTRVGGRTLTQSALGTNLPLETSVMNHVRGLERIFEFRNRSVYNFERLTLMINNMPLADPEYCGRLRDHLCIATESAEAKLKALESEEANRNTQAGILDAIEHIGAMAGSMRAAHLSDKAASSELFIGMEQKLAKAFVNLGMSEDQERYLGDMISGFMRDLVQLNDRSDATYESLQALSERLGQLKRVG